MLGDLLVCMSRIWIKERKHIYYYRNDRIHLVTKAFYLFWQQAYDRLLKKGETTPFSYQVTE